MLNNKKVDYLLIGGFAVIIHSEPRYTKDLDIWVRPSKENSQKIYSALAEFGAPLQQLNIKTSDFENEGYFVQLGVEPVRIDILMSVKGMDFATAWNNRVEAQLGEITVPVISRQDLIDVKLETGRPQDLLDATALKKSSKSGT